jgi:Family of unknown function (DUF5678)
MSSTEQEEKLVKNEVHAHDNLFDFNLVETANQVKDHTDSGLILLGFLAQTKKLVSVMNCQPYDTKEDFDCFTSGQLETDSFKGQHIAIWKKQVVGSGETPLEAERIAKAYYGDDCRPAVVYIPKDEEVDTIF